MGNQVSNSKLRKEGEVHQLTQEQLDEYTLCADSFEYFLDNYFKIITLDDGITQFKARGYQADMANLIHENRYSIFNFCRQSGKSTLVVGYFLWMVLFHPGYNIVIVANVGKLAKKLLAKIKLAYEYIPMWMQQGVVRWNMSDIELENKSKIEATTSMRGDSVDMLYVDEFAHIKNTQAEDFFAAAYPTLSSGAHTKIIITSTPKGLNHFYKMWQDAVDGKNEFVYKEVHWYEVPGRDEEWKAKEIANTSEDQFSQEQDISFLGSARTLIAPHILRSMVFEDPKDILHDLHVYQDPIEGHEYVVIVDTSRGVDIDYSAFTVIDVSDMPYNLVAKYRKNDIDPHFYPNVIADTAKTYNSAFVLVEINDIGAQVADILYREIEYENIFMTTNGGHKGQQVGEKFNKQTQLGVRTTNQVKRIGCANLKTLIEREQLLIKDFDVIKELSNFVVSKNSYAAEVGEHDDLVMCLVLFAWLAKQDYFKELTNIDFRKRLLTDNQNMIENDILPFAFVDDGTVSSDLDVNYPDDFKFLMGKDEECDWEESEFF